MPVISRAEFDASLEDEDDLPTNNLLVPVATDPIVASTKKPEPPYVERGPMDLQTYINKGQMPNYIRVNVKGHNFRKTPDFRGVAKNIDFKSKGGDLFAVESIRPLDYGTAVQVHVDGELRWVYVSNKSTDEFQFCESEACFSAMAQSLDFFIKGTGVTNAHAVNCGVSVGPEGLILPAGAPGPMKEPEQFLAEVSMEKPSPLTVKPLWELQGKPAAWTKMLEESLEKYGKGLLKQKHLSDAANFCPNFSRLNDAQKKEFWIHLFNGIAKYESDFKLGKPAFKEPRRRGEKGVNVFRGPIDPERFSMGLFQLSYESSQGRKYQPGCAGISWKKDRHKRVEDKDLTIYDPKIQMDCAVTIMNTWVSRDGGLGGAPDHGGAMYWSTLRDSNGATQDVKKSLRRFKPCGVR